MLKRHGYEKPVSDLHSVVKYLGVHIFMKGFGNFYTGIKYQLNKPLRLKK